MKKENYKGVEFELISFDSNDVIIASESTWSYLPPVVENETEEFE